MIRSASFYRLAACHKRRGVGSSAAGACHRHRPIILICHNYLSTEAAHAQSSAVNNETNDAAESQSKTEGKPKFVSFFDEVDEIMKRDSPVQYQRFLDSKAASESWRAMQQRNEQSRRRLEMEQDTNKFSKDVIPRTDSLDENPAFANYDDKSADSAKPTTHEEETPWYKQRNDIQMVTSPSSKSTTLPNKYQNFLQEKLVQPSTTTSNKPDDEIASKKSGGVFSSISKSALNIKDGDTSTSIPLSELFPTLYSNDLQSKKKPMLKKPVNPAMVYDPDHFEAYQEAMTAVFAHNVTEKYARKYENRGDSHKRIVQKVKAWLMHDHRIVDSDVVGGRWSNLDEAWRSEKWMTGISASESSGGDNGVDENTELKFHSELKAQRELFLSKLLNDETLPSTYAPDSDDKSLESPGEHLTEAEIKPLFHEIAQHFMGSLGRYCARRARSLPMEVAWIKVKESGLFLPKDIICTYLYVVSTMGMTDSIGISSGFDVGSYPFSDSEKGSGGGDESKSKKNRYLIPEEVATYHDLSSKPTESSISLRVKAMASKGDTKSAEELLEAFKKSIEADKESKESIRLRTYLPIFKQYCETGNISAALSLFKQMQSTQGVILEPETYVLLLASTAENGYFCNNSSPIEDAQNLGYSHSHGPKLFDAIATEMAQDSLDITSASARQLSNALALGFKEFQRDPNSASGDNVDLVSTLKEVHPLVTLPISRKLANDNEVVASRVSLDRSTGICPVTNVQQRLIVLEPDQRNQLHGDLLDLSEEQFANFAGKRAEDSPKRAREQLQLFSDWLDKREGEPFTAIVDGANIGYYMQSFDKGRFNYHQIKFIVDTLEERGENPLVVLPNKYVHHEFYQSKREHQKLDHAEIEIMKDLVKSGKLYKVPPRCLDDFYWMLASVSDQTASRQGQDISVPSDDPDGRFPGTRPMLITNDQMRDHKLELLEPRLFRRWYGCHIVNYNFTAFVMGESVDGNEVGFSQADFFSREIQGNQCPSNHDESHSLAWHFPVNDWELDERFVIRIPTNKQ